MEEEINFPLSPFKVWQGFNGTTRPNFLLSQLSDQCETETLGTLDLITSIRTIRDTLWFCNLVWTPLAEKGLVLKDSQTSEKE